MDEEHLRGRTGLGLRDKEEKVQKHHGKEDKVCLGSCTDSSIKDNIDDSYNFFSPSCYK